MARVKVGDVFEVSTDRGLVYAQCTHRHRMYGELIRVLPGFFEMRPEEFAELVRQPANTLLIERIVSDWTPETDPT